MKILEGHIVALQQNITDLGARIANITCSGIQNINGVPSVNGSFFINDDGTSSLIDLQTLQDGILINGTLLQNELDVQQVIFIFKQKM